MPIHGNVRVGTEVTFGRGDLVFVPLGSLKGPGNILFPTGGVSPRDPHRDRHYRHFSLGALLCFIEMGCTVSDFAVPC